MITYLGTKNKWLSLIFLLICLIFIGSSVYLIKLIDKSKIAITNKETELFNSENKLKSLVVMSKQDEEHKAIITKTNLLWPDDKEINSFIIQLEKLAQSENLTFNNLSLTEPKAVKKTDKTKEKKPALNSVQFSFDTNGSTASLYNILKKLQSFERLNNLTEINFTARDDQVSMKVTGNIYYGK